MPGAAYERAGPNTLMPPGAIRRAEITVSVVARRYRNNTALHVTAGQHGRLVTLGTWVDLCIWRDADGYATPWWLEWARRARSRGPYRRDADCRRETGSCRSAPQGTASVLLRAIVVRFGCRPAGSWRSSLTTCPASAGIISARCGRGSPGCPSPAVWCTGTCGPNPTRASRHEVPGNAYRGWRNRLVSAMTPGQRPPLAGISALRYRALIQATSIEGACASGCISRTRSLLRIR